MKLTQYEFSVISCVQMALKLQIGTKILELEWVLFCLFCFSCFMFWCFAESCVQRTEKLRPKSKAFFCNFSILNLILGWISEEKPSFFAEKSDRYVYELNSTLKETFWNLKMILLQLKMGLTYFRSVFYINDRRVIVIVFDP